MLISVYVSMHNYVHFVTTKIFTVHCHINKLKVFNTHITSKMEHLKYNLHPQH